MKGYEKIFWFECRNWLKVTEGARFWNRQLVSQAYWSLHFVGSKCYDHIYILERQFCQLCGVWMRDKLGGRGVRRLLQKSRRCDGLGEGGGCETWQKRQMWETVGKWMRQDLITEGEEVAQGNSRVSVLSSLVESGPLTVRCQVRCWGQVNRAEEWY